MMLDERLEKMIEDTQQAFPRREDEPVPQWLRGALVDGRLCRQDVDDLLAYLDCEIGPADESREASFTLGNTPARKRPWRPENEPTRQKALFSGLDCLPGQSDLFDC